ncbi:MAG: hypothetical protein A2Y87_08515 [Bacteroidetes bacterium RBG_13_46_8]|nr:MAG: hypothetical protein A2Y87_08515 [Bacteroidetes bacterium RBG_13_46_8]
MFVSGYSRRQDGKESFQSIPVAKVPASFPVNFALFTAGERQYVAYYDTAHLMTIACRKSGNATWDFQKLDSKVGWDSHNYLAMVIDGKGYIHLTGNMHSSELIYYRSSIPYDIHSIQALNVMTGKEEDVVTYPVFMHGPKNELIFHYRYGRSGSGYEVFNLWDAETMQWTRLLDKPLTDGRGKMNAYMQGPTLGPDGYYHIIWVWRNTPDCATNHTLSYARSKDLLHWESIRGEKVELPLTIDYKELYVDTTPVNGGLINIGIKIGFDRSGKVLIGYHKYDAAGNTQLFLTRFADGTWLSKKVTTWDYRWDFKGVGTIVNELLIEPPRPSSHGRNLVFGYHHINYGDGQVVVKQRSLKPLEVNSLETSYPAELDKVRSEFPGMAVNKFYDSGEAQKGQRYMLRWETLIPNRDQRREKGLPPDTMLELVSY